MLKAADWIDLNIGDLVQREHPKNSDGIGVGVRSFLSRKPAIALK